jgi:hypothetical protein
MSPEQNMQSGGSSRQLFLKALGLGGVVTGTARLLPGPAAHAQRARQRRFVIPEDRFRCLFPELPPFGLWADGGPTMQRGGTHIAWAMAVPGEPAVRRGRDRQRSASWRCQHL